MVWIRIAVSWAPERPGLVLLAVFVYLAAGAEAAMAQRASTPWSGGGPWRPIDPDELRRMLERRLRDEADTRRRPEREPTASSGRRVRDVRFTVYE